MLARPWTTLELAHAISLREDGHKIATIARKLTRTALSVSCRLRKAGYAGPSHKWRKNGSLAAAVRKLARPGVSDAEIAVRLRVGRELVYRTRKRLGIPAGVPRGGYRRSPVRRNPRPECWHCGTRSRYCSAGNSLASQGWWSKKGAGGHEAYCRECVELYGTPDEWHLPSSSPHGSVPASDSADSVK